jgi:hypothetical protein
VTSAHFTIIQPDLPYSATATFQVATAPTAAADRLQLAVEGACWIPNTRFSVS